MCRPRQKMGGRKKRHHNTVEDTWLTCHRQFVKELEEWDKQGGWDVLFYGDSIVEEWRCAPLSLSALVARAAAVAASAELEERASRAAGAPMVNGH